jgi:hypothetical protein
MEIGNLVKKFIVEQKNRKERGKCDEVSGCLLDRDLPVILSLELDSLNMNHTQPD